MGTDYKPIPCAAYETLERYVISGREVALLYVNGDGTCHERTVIVDLLTEGGVEYAVLASSGRLRLDRIVRVDDVALADLGNCRL